MPLSIILDNDQLDTHLLYFMYNTFIIILYMFQALYAHHQEVELYWYSIWYRLSENKWVVLALPNHNPRQLTCYQSDDTICCISTIQTPDDEHIMLETSRGL